MKAIKVLNFVCRKWTRLQKDESGNIIIIVAIAMFLLIIGVGTAIDMARAQILQSRMYIATDSEALSAGIVAARMPPGTATEAILQAAAQKYFDVNFPSDYLGTTVTEPQIQYDGTTVTVSGAGTEPTMFMKLSGQSSVNVSTLSKVSSTTSGGIELVMVLDNSGSMNDYANTSETVTKLNAVKADATALVEAVYGNNDTLQDVFMGVVPFSQTVNIGTDHKDWMALDPGYASYPGYDWGPHGSWYGCVEERDAGGSGATDGAPVPPLTDNPPTSANPFPVYYFAPEPDAIRCDAYGYYQNLNPWSANAVAVSGAPYCSCYPQYIPDQQMFPSSHMNIGWITSAGLNQYYPGMCQNGTKLMAVSNIQLNTPITDGGDAPYLTLSTTKYGPNLYCPEPMTSLTNNKIAVENAINKMVATGDTLMDVGIAWGWRMLSPNWGGYWQPHNPLPYYNPIIPSTTNSNKYVVFMTDGWSHVIPYNYTSYSWLQDWILNTHDEPTAESIINARFLAVCNTLKQNNVIVWTIALGDSQCASSFSDGYIDPNNNACSTADKASANYVLLQQCATPGDFRQAPTNAALQSAFGDIANSLKNLHVSQ